MQTNRVLLGTLVYFVILFVCSGLSQVLPWGVSSANSIRAASPSATQSFGTSEVRTFAPHALTTEQFDQEMVDRVTVLMTDETVSWIVTKPLSYYDPARYMAWEALTQACVALVLSLVLGLTTSMALKTRLMLVALAGVAASLATYGQLLNWWGLPPVYAIGASVNLVLAWLLGGLVVARFIIKSTAA